MQDEVKIKHSRLQQLVERLWHFAGSSEHQARCFADRLVAANLAGMPEAELAAYSLQDSDVTALPCRASGRADARRLLTGKQQLQPGSAEEHGKNTFNCAAAFAITPAHGLGGKQQRITAEYHHPQQSTAANNQWQQRRRRIGSDAQRHNRGPDQDGFRVSQMQQQTAAIERTR